ncbi:IS630 transposase-related protein [Suttonella ornithocola]|uniref:Transposase n=1 Tax=Suttonella ornithocola TaxID=279832 RepID=A0A380MN56_9GAMM|nr:IS630 transposase-related protein [Suttonella ornithocola]SUO93476.1 Transposase [Suttonella ornithocola]SUO95500.1 Transposase [Suttonella ornithocola]
MAYSSDYRQMILTKLKEGASFRELAEEYQLIPTTIQRWKKNPERKKRVFKPLKIDNKLLKADVKSYPDDYQWKRASYLVVAKNLSGVR